MESGTSSTAAGVSSRGRKPKYSSSLEKALHYKEKRQGKNRFYFHAGTTVEDSLKWTVIGPSDTSDFNFQKVQLNIDDNFTRTEYLEVYPEGNVVVHGWACVLCALISVTPSILKQHKCSFEHIRRCPDFVSICKTFLQQTAGVLRSTTLGLQFFKEYVIDKNPGWQARLLEMKDWLAPIMGLAPVPDQIPASTSQASVNQNGPLTQLLIDADRDGSIRTSSHQLPSLQTPNLYRHDTALASGGSATFTPGQHLNQPLPFGAYAAPENFRLVPTGSAVQAVSGGHVRWTCFKMEGLPLLWELECHRCNPCIHDRRNAGISIWCLLTPLCLQIICR